MRVSDREPVTAKDATDTECAACKGAAGDAPVRPVLLTIDGPAGTGKSSVAHQLAQRLGLDFLDTGAMYRAAAWLAHRRGIDPADGVAVAAAVERAEIRFDWTTKPPAIHVDGESVADAIRSLAVSEIVSTVAAQPEVRVVLVEHQRRIAHAHPRLVTEGRDQGSVVFPDASLRFYLDADVHVRALRRARQLLSTGTDVDIEAVARDIERRDRIDTGRATAPLIRPEGAIEIDTTELDLQQVVDRLESISRDRLPDASFRS
jgi:cytidylate kinase